MQPESILAVLLPLSAAAILISSLMFRFRRREFQHKEWLTAIEKGLPLPVGSDLGIPSGGARPYLLRGLLWLFSGIGVLVFLAGVSFTTNASKTTMEKAVQSQRLKRMGASEELIRQVQNDTTPQNSFPRAFCLIGLVPIGVGLAYLVFYRSEKSGNAKR